MPLLISGLVIWIAVHFLPSAGIKLKQKLVSSYGNKTYTLGFTVLILLALALIILGWRSTTPQYLYYLSGAFRPLALLLVLIGFILFGAAKYPTRIKQYVRHPQLTGLIFWSSGHLLLNGDSRSVVLFSGLGLWALAEILLINKRDGVWVKPEVPGWGRELRGLAISLVIIMVVVFIHPYIAGVPIR